jgi:hypothetical protein
MGATKGMARIGEDEWVKGAWKHAFMEFIHEVNRRCADADIEPVFGEPTSLGDWWVPGMYCEEYPRARVIYPKKEHKGHGEGYRIVTDDEELWPMWNDAMVAVEQRIERRDSGDPNPHD